MKIQHIIDVIHSCFLTHRCHPLLSIQMYKNTNQSIHTAYVHTEMDTDVQQFFNQFNLLLIQLFHSCICACVNKVLLPDYFKSTISIFFSFN